MTNTAERVLSAEHKIRSALEARGEIQGVLAVATTGAGAAGAAALAATAVPPLITTATAFAKQIGDGDASMQSAGEGGGVAAVPGAVPTTTTTTTTTATSSLPSSSEKEEEEEEEEKDSLTKMMETFVRTWHSVIIMQAYECT